MLYIHIIDFVNSYLSGVFAELMHLANVQKAVQILLINRIQSSF